MRALRFLFLATLFSITFERLHWSVGGNLSISDLLTAAFAVAFIAHSAQRQAWRARLRNARAFGRAMSARGTHEQLSSPSSADAQRDHSSKRPGGPVCRQPSSCPGVQRQRPRVFLAA